MKKVKSILMLPFVFLFFTSGNSQTNENVILTIIDTCFAKGTDVGWLPQMGATGYKFYDTDRAEKDCLQVLNDRGMNTIRLRVWGTSLK